MGSLSIAELGAMLPRQGVCTSTCAKRTDVRSPFCSAGPTSSSAVPLRSGRSPSSSSGRCSKWRDGGSRYLECIAFEIDIILAMAWVNILGVIWGGRLGPDDRQGGLSRGRGDPPLRGGLFPIAPLEAANLATTVTPQKPTLSTQFAAALLGVLWAYNGWGRRLRGRGNPRAAEKYPTGPLRRTGHPDRALRLGQHCLSRCLADGPDCQIGRARGRSDV